MHSSDFVLMGWVAASLHVVVLLSFRATSAWRFGPLAARMSYTTSFVDLTGLSQDEQWRIESHPK